MAGTWGQPPAAPASAGCFYPRLALPWPAIPRSEMNAPPQPSLPIDANAGRRFEAAWRQGRAPIRWHCITHLAAGSPGVLYRFQVFLS
jgi:hypothetical protein